MIFILLGLRRPYVRLKTLAKKRAESLRNNMLIGLSVLSSLLSSGVGVQEALRRMSAGEKSLALHANCGTNYVTAGVIAGTLAWLATLVGGNTFKKKLDRWPLLMMIVTGSLIAAQPLGPKVQAKISTSGEPGNLKVRQIVRYERQGPVLHRILTADVAPEPMITTESMES